MKLTEFDYDLPKELIAQTPLKERDKARLMVLEKDKQVINERAFSDITGYVKQGDAIVLNDTRVIPVRLYGKRKTGGKVEIFLLNPKEDRLQALIRPSQRIKEGEEIQLESASGKKSIAHYSPAIVHNNIVYVSGQLPLPRGSTTPPSGDVEEQTRVALRNFAEVLEAAGSSLDKVLQTTAYIPDVSLWGHVNKVYAEIFTKHKPARTVVPSNKLHYDCLIEIDAIAYIDEE